MLEQIALIAAHKTIQSAKEIPLNVINASFRTVPQPTFLDDNNQPALCVSRRFHSLEQIKETLDQMQRNGSIVYVYKLFELKKYGRDLEPTGEKLYHLRYCVR